MQPAMNMLQKIGLAEWITRCLLQLKMQIKNSRQIDRPIPFKPKMISLEIPSSADSRISEARKQCNETRIVSIILIMAWLKMNSSSFLRHCLILGHAYQECIHWCFHRGSNPSDTTRMNYMKAQTADREAHLKWTSAGMSLIKPKHRCLETFHRGRKLIYCRKTEFGLTPMQKRLRKNKYIHMRCETSLWSSKQ